MTPGVTGASRLSPFNGTNHRLLTSLMTQHLEQREKERDLMCMVECTIVNVFMADVAERDSHRLFFLYSLLLKHT